MNANKNNQLQNDALESVAGGGDPVEDKCIDEAKAIFEFGVNMMENARKQLETGQITKEQMSIYYEHLMRIATEAGLKMDELSKLWGMN